MIAAVQGRDGPANHNRLCVKGRFGFGLCDPPPRLTTPLIRRDDDAPKSADCEVDPANPFTHFRAATWEEALGRRGGRTCRDSRPRRRAALAGFGSAKGSNEEAYLVQKMVRQGSAPTTSTTVRACVTPRRSSRSSKASARRR